MAFDNQLAVLRPEVLRFAYWLSRDRALAEDLVQETLIRAWRAREQLKDSTALRKWLMTICRREHARLYQRKRHETVDIDELVGDAQPVAPARHSDEMDELHDAILQLDDVYREPLIMQALLGYSTGEIAEELGIKVGAVLTRLFRARNQLRERLVTAEGA
jgi:RNA polymerase sigma-70 factor (ECF subfamily)